jgi:tRNA pseudouridine55 synthase
MLGVGAHLTALRRTRSGPYRVEHAHTIEELEQAFATTPLAQAVAEVFPRIEVSEVDAARIGHGQRVALEIETSPSGVFAPDGRVVALVEDRGGLARPLCVFG